MRRYIAAVLLLALILTGCGGSSEDLMAKYIPRAVEVGEVSGTGAVDFAVDLFRSSVTAGENTLVSPLSVYAALSMAANGAKGETLAQLDAVLGGGCAARNDWFYGYLNTLEKEEMLHLANGIWFNTHERFTPEKAFLQTNADYYEASVYGAPFDLTTLADINQWISRNTDGMIRNMLDEIPDEGVMYLVNALAFEADWVTMYEENQVRDGVFTTEDGRSLEVELMYGTDYRYLENDNATGFMRYYRGNDYAFVALLPKEGRTVSQLVDSLTGTDLAALLSQPQAVTVETAIPKFEAECMVNMNEILMDMGITDAFDPEMADLSGLGTSAAGNICINRVLHKTFLSVAEKGTRAGAATIVEATDRAMEMTDSKKVYLDRPFVYMIVDCSENLPFFMGTCMEIS